MRAWRRRLVGQAGFPREARRCEGPFRLRDRWLESIASAQHRVGAHAGRAAIRRRESSAVEARASPRFGCRQRWPRANRRSTRSAGRSSIARRADLAVPAVETRRCTSRSRRQRGSDGPATPSGRHRTMRARATIAGGLRRGLGRRHVTHPKAFRSSPSHASTPQSSGAARKASASSVAPSHLAGVLESGVGFPPGFDATPPCERPGRAQVKPLDRVAHRSQLLCGRAPRRLESAKATVEHQPGRPVEGGGRRSQVSSVPQGSIWKTPEGSL